MTGKQIMFFTVFEDIEQILIDIETIVDIRYYMAGLFDSENITAYNSIFDSNNVGFTSSGDWNRIDRYMVMKKEIPLYVEAVPQRRGGIKYAVDQEGNPKSIEIKLGGIYTEKENVIVAGRASTISQENDSLELYKLFSSKIKKKFKRFGMFYVGPEAEKKLREGWRLVQNEGFAKGYDLTLDG